MLQSRLVCIIYFFQPTLSPPFFLVKKNVLKLELFFLVFSLFSHVQNRNLAEPQTVVMGSTVVKVESPAARIEEGEALVVEAPKTVFAVRNIVNITLVTETRKVC